MVFNRKLKVLFNKVPNIYDSSRKGYPLNIYKDILRTSKISKRDDILDVGCGSGLSSSQFIKNNYKVSGIDISENLICVAKEHFPKTKFMVASFEDYDFKNKKFRLIISGQAFHWLNQGIAYDKSHKLLRDDGIMALFSKFNDHSQSKFLFNLRELFITNCKYYPLDLDVDSYMKDYIGEIEE